MGTGLSGWGVVPYELGGGAASGGELVMLAVVEADGGHMLVLSSVC